ncbi:MAG: peptidase [Vicinamibacteraceae bacterium]|nr:peptidase [Vicinamibacteraceae bacterium]
MPRLRAHHLGAAVLAGAVTLLFTAPASAGARIHIINNNAPGIGFNDPTPAAPVGGNPGTTKGEQRLIAFQYAASLWGLMLDSNVDIYVRAQFVPLGANVLGSAGATFIYRNFTGEPGFPGAEYPATWYHSALADKRAGTDMRQVFGGPAGDPDINANFSSNFDFYLGLDGNHGAQVDLVTVVLHELGHGLGFANFVNEVTGSNQSGGTDIYSQFTLDTTTGTRWAEIVPDASGNALRAASALRVDKIVWNGATVTAAVPHVLSFGRPEINVYSPAAIAGSARVGTASFGPALGSPGVSGDVVMGLDPADASGPSTTDACSPLTNAAAVAGRIALVDRGTCAFVIKVKNAQDAGAIAVLVADNVAGDPPAGLGGTDPTITIPSVRIAQALGAAMKAQLAAAETVAANIGIDLTQLAGADPSGFAQLYATNPVQSGSSISHYDNIAFRNLLMEPAINSDLTHELIPPYDLSLALMRDIGWFVDGNLDGTPDETFTFGTCTTNQPNTTLSNGATLDDMARVWYRDCAAGARNHGAFVSCVAHATNAAVASGLITGAQKGAVQRCAARTR